VERVCGKGRGSGESVWKGEGGLELDIVQGPQSS